LAEVKETASITKILASLPVQLSFMDGYNFDLKRIQKCGKHYAVPDGRIIPFCTMNIMHRQEVERKFAKKIAEEEVKPILPQAT